ncbi:MAG: filamentation induced by cAMP protein fic [Candidatus Peregrinibacteria bacterium Greene0416_19]|nr:MAG: filamentation induced by cAMP protein fic [Candidatus Peregrinibacteria bacterium Greene0416_19]
MSWNWQQKHWPTFIYDARQLEALEREFAQLLGTVTGTMKHLKEQERDQIVVQLLSTEGVKTAEIEGELLDRDSVQSSIRRKLGLSTVKRNVQPAEAGMAEMMVTVYRQYAAPLTREELDAWNAALMQGRTDLERIGAYRTHQDPMQIVSGAIGSESVHFEAPPSKDVPRHMKEFIRWFNDSLKTLPPLTRAGIAHLYAVSIHPYEDGNGRMARALVEKALSQSAGAPALSGVSRQIVIKKSTYYDTLERNNQDLEITDWLLTFGKTLIAAKKYVLASVEGVLQKASLYSKFSSELNERQKKAIDRLFEAGPEGFVGGLSAGKYITITKAKRATATRDLQTLVDLGILRKTGERRHARYRLPEIAR